MVIIKKQGDLKDEFNVYRINNGSMNNCSDYVFKSSRVMAELTVQMDVTGPENILQQENTYVGVTHTHVHGFKSLGLWLYHPILRKIIRLASMDIRTENTKDIALCFTMFNEILQKVTGKPNYKFNPRYTMYNGGGANHKAIKYVYGEEFAKARVVVCQWHFRRNATKKARSMPEDMQDIFNKTCEKLCKSTTTTSQYNLLKEQLEELAKKHTTLNPWIQWWHVCRSHIFAPFRGGDLHGVNLSEMGNAGWKPYNTLRLVHAAKQDTATMILQEKEIYLFNRNQAKSTSQVPSKAVRNSRDRQEQVKIAKDFVNI